MEEDRLKALGRYVLARRLELKIEKGKDLAELLRVTPRVVTDIERGNRRAGPGTYVKLEQVLQWADGSVAAVLDGGEPTPLEAWEPIPQEHVQGRRLDESDPVDHALQEFQRAASELVRAETEFDNQMRRWAIKEILGERVRAEATRRAEELGRPLTEAEWLAIDDLPRPTSTEVAEFQAWSALHDAREWTRYEMALIEAIWTDYPHDVRAGSTYADLEPFRARVQRLVAGDQAETPLPGRVTPVYRWAGPSPSEGGDGDGDSAPTRDAIELVAHEEGHTIESEQGHDENP